MKKRAIYVVIGVLIFLAGLMAAVRPSVATGNSGGASISCTLITFSYSGFANAANEVSESVLVDGNSIYSATFSFTGSSGSHAVTISVPRDGNDHEIIASANWDTNGHRGSFREKTSVNCGEDETQPPTETEPPTTTEPPTETTPTTPEPPHVCPDGLPPDAGKDGEPGNDDCDHAQPSAITTETTMPPVTTETTPPTVITPTPEETETTTPTAVLPKPKPKLPVGAPTPPKKNPETGGLTCPNGTRIFKGKCHGIISGSG